MALVNKTFGYVLIVMGVLLLVSSYLPFTIIGLGETKIMHGETKTFTTVISVPCTITSLKPPTGTHVSLLGTLQSQPAAYGELTVSWNVYEGQIFKQADVPKTVVCTISFRAWKGEYYGDEYGEPAADMGLCVYPKITFEPTVTVAPPTEPSQPVEQTLPETDTSVYEADEPVPDAPPETESLPDGVAVEPSRFGTAAIFGLMLTGVGLILILLRRR